MHPTQTQERVKSCLHCDAIIPFTARECPSCHTSAVIETETLCEACTAPLKNDAVFCPSCGELALPIAAAPLLDDRIGVDTRKAGATLEWGITCFKSVTIFAFCWVLIERLIL